MSGFKTVRVWWVAPLLPSVSCLNISSPGVKPDRPVLFLNLRPAVHANNFYSERRWWPQSENLSHPLQCCVQLGNFSVNSSTLSFFWKNKLSQLLSAIQYGMSCSSAKRRFSRKEESSSVYWKFTKLTSLWDWLKCCLNSEWWENSQLDFMMFS